MTIKVGFALLSSPDNPLPSTRIAALNMFAPLEARGYLPQIVFFSRQADEEPEISIVAGDLWRADFRIVVFQKIHGPRVLALASALEAVGIRTIYLVCDLVEVGLASATSATVVVTEFLKNLYPATLHRKIFVVHDGIERPDIVARRDDLRFGSFFRPLRAVMVTSNAMSTLPALDGIPSWLRITVLGRYPARRAWLDRLRLIKQFWDEQPTDRARLAILRFWLDPRIRRIPWTADAVYRVIQSADVGIIPIEVESALDVSAGHIPNWAVKSENRLTLMMAAGLPVISTPIPSYEDVVEENHNGYFARRPADWDDALEKLRDPDLRRKVGGNARAAVLEPFSIESQAIKLVAVFESVLRWTEQAPPPIDHVIEPGVGSTPQ